MVQALPNIHTRMGKPTHMYSSHPRHKFCLKQMFCTEWSMTCTAVKFSLKQYRAFSHKEDTTRQQRNHSPGHIILIHRINHLLSHKFTKKKPNLLETMQYSGYPQNKASITFSNIHTCVVRKDHKNTCYILLTFLLLGTG